ncbi:MAG TPA: SMC-Scp complex subunit ScpB, partial [Ktedonobacteraceae bacterium]
LKMMNGAIFELGIDLYDILIPTMEQNVLDIQLPISIADRQLGAAIESLLFVSGRPLERTELRKLLDVDDQRLSNALRALKQDLDSQGRGIRLQTLGEKVQLVTAPENARYVAALLGLPITAKLTPAALETLAVIAYRQPLTRSQIEAIRGVNSDRALASLLQHGLVAEVGRAQTIGRPALFATAAEFLQQFGLTSLDQLPGIPLGEQSAGTEPSTQAPNGTEAISPVALATHADHSEER